jgi:hypothetical protein
MVMIHDDAEVQCYYANEAEREDPTLTSFHTKILFYALIFNHDFLLSLRTLARAYNTTYEVVIDFSRFNRRRAQIKLDVVKA